MNDLTWIDPAKPSGAPAAPNPPRFRAVLEDQILHWMRSSHDSHIWCVIHLDGCLDEERLARAARLCLDAEPVLGARLVCGLRRQYWERHPDPDRLKLCAVAHSPEVSPDVSAFLARTPAMEDGAPPQVRQFILRTPGRDILCVKINHVAADAAGLKDYLYLLADTYRRLAAEPGYRPPANPSGARSLTQVSRRLTAADKLRILRRGLRDAADFISPVACLPGSPNGHPFSPARARLLLHTLSPAAFDKLLCRARQEGATLNDIMVTAFLRSFYALVTPSPQAYLRTVMTADLRRYLPDERAGSVCNLSGFVYLDIGRRRDPSFRETLIRVRSRMNRLKADYIGLGNLPLSAFLFKTLPFPWALGIHSRMGGLQKNQVRSFGTAAPLLTNTGRLDPGRLVFDGPRVTNAFLTTTIAWPPVVAVGISTFGPTLTLSAGCCETVLAEEEVNQVFARVESEILHG